MTASAYAGDAFIRKVRGSYVLRLEDLHLFSAYTRMDTDRRVTSVYAGERLMIDEGFRCSARCESKYSGTLWYGLRGSIYVH